MKMCSPIQQLTSLTISGAFHSSGKTPSRRASLRDVSGSRRGSAVVEMALVTSIVMILLVGIIQFSFAFFIIGTLNNAGAEGARFGSINPYDTVAIQNRVRNLVGGLDRSKLQIDVTFPDGSAQPSNRITVTVSYPMTSVLFGFPSQTIVRSSTCRIEKE